MAKRDIQRDAIFIQVPSSNKGAAFTQVLSSNKGGLSILFLIKKNFRITILTPGDPSHQGRVSCLGRISREPMGIEIITNSIEQWNFFHRETRQEGEILV